MAPQLWMIFMLAVLVGWTAWLYGDIAHPNSEQRARVSLAIVAAIGVVTIPMFMLIFSGSGQ